jgi:acetyl-CoA carboxylase alpha subunit
MADEEAEILQLIDRNNEKSKKNYEAAQQWKERYDTLERCRADDRATYDNFAKHTKQGFGTLSKGQDSQSAAIATAVERFDGIDSQLWGHGEDFDKLLRGQTSCALKRAANNEVLHNLNAPLSQAKTRL